ncbi:hypothetical protein GOBAR_AA15444 [Gossypium barbadense]|uniref:Auxin-responsive protein n=1 Tax=Gossypium barbadense TaxID=3634 RepID=A0A2P5XPE4_GOSBA|nr:hypothetical protein GOBAR_AA15444 [Gossypium barbadense]
MSTPLEHDYIGLSETSSVERSSEKIPSSSSPSSSSTHPNEDKTTRTSLNLKETELRLGLPAKRGFSDAIDGPNGKWVFPMHGKSDVELAKGAVLASPRAVLEGKNNLPSMREVGGLPQSPNPVQDKNILVPSSNEHSNPPASNVVDSNCVLHTADITTIRKGLFLELFNFRMCSSCTFDGHQYDHSGRIRWPQNSEKNGEDAAGCHYVKVSMDGAPYLRKVDLKTYKTYMELSSALEKMFTCFTLGHCSSNGLAVRDGLSESRLMDLLHGSEYVLTYEDKDGDWMLVGDVPWEMFINSCKRLRIVKGSEAIGLAPRAMEKCKNQS